MYEEFKSEVDKFIEFLNNRVKTYEFNSEEEYDKVIDKAVIEYYRAGNRALVFDDMDWFEENLEEYEGVNSYSMIHSYTNRWEQIERPRGLFPREHTDFVKSINGEYEAVITTLSNPGFRFYVFEKMLTPNNIFIPQFLLESIHKCGNSGFLYQINPEDIYKYDPFK